MTEKRTGKNRYSWDAYHIENYLLEETYILDVIKEINLQEVQLHGASDVERVLRTIAQNQIDELVRIQIQSDLNRALVSKLSLNSNGSGELCSTLRRQAKRSLDAMRNTIDTEMTEVKLRENMKEKKKQLIQALETDHWKNRFRGRDILKAFVCKYGCGIKYERFRDTIINRMRERGYQPTGMRNVLRRIDAS